MIHNTNQEITAYKTQYKAKVSYLLLATTLLIVAISFLPLLLSHYFWIALGGWIVIAAFITYSFIATSYEISEDKLFIKSAGLPPKIIDINTITSIKKTNNGASSPAPSFDRLEISYQQNKKIMISPRDKNQLINAITNQNAAIILFTKKK